MNYIAGIEKDTDSTYGIRFPEAPGRLSAADTLEDILPNAVEALRPFLEDFDPLPSRGLEAVRQEVAENIAEGAVLMMVPLVQNRRRVVRVDLSLEKGSRYAR